MLQRWPTRRTSSATSFCRLRRPLRRFVAGVRRIYAVRHPVPQPSGQRDPVHRARSEPGADEQLPVSTLTRWMATTWPVRRNPIRRRSAADCADAVGLTPSWAPQVTPTSADVQITATWTDNAVNETNYIVTRTGPSLTAPVNGKVTGTATPITLPGKPANILGDLPP